MFLCMISHSNNLFILKCTRSKKPCFGLDTGSVVRYTRLTKACCILECLRSARSRRYKKMPPPVYLC